VLERHRRWQPYLFVIVLALGLSGCGISAQSDPVDEGDAVVGSPVVLDTDAKPPPSPNAANTAEGLVGNYLKAAAGGSASAIEQVKKFLSANALAAWHDPANADNPPLNIIRIVSGPTTGAAVGARTPVTVDYQVVGEMNDKGRVDELAELTTHRMTFWVVLPEQTSNPRIDEIVGAPPGLLLSDDALNNDYYRIQPIYFWDQSYTTLVPDLRYLPLTIKPDQRASRLLQWLVAGPSSSLAGGVQALPTGTSATDNVVTKDDGTLVVKLSAQANTGNPDALRRLLFELQWTLSVNGGSTKVELYIDDKLVTVPASADEFLDQNHSYSYRGVVPKFNISTDQKVVPVPTGIPVPPVLSTPDNANMVWAAVGQNNRAAAFVRQESSGRRYLQIVRDGVDGHVDSHLPRSFTLGRPSFVPGVNDIVLIPTGGPDGRLMAVSMQDGTYTNATLNFTGVSSATVSPDGRRVAFVAGGQVYVSSLIVANNTVRVGSNARPILAGQLNATAVTWTSESWLFVAGTADGAATMWKVTADSVVAQNYTDSMGGLGVPVDGLVAYPQWSGRGTVDVLAITPQGVYTFRQLFTPETSLRSPFFGS
jgi:hypothetical protein